MIQRFRRQQWRMLILTVIVTWLVLFGLYLLTRYWQLQINISSSMPQKLWLIHVGDTRLKVGDFVVIKFHDKRMQNPVDYEYVGKQIGGIAGDTIKVKKVASNQVRFVYILSSGQYLVFDTLSKNHFTPLTMSNIVIPPNCYFVHGLHDPSFDSRYKEFGLICSKLTSPEAGELGVFHNQIFGKAYPFF